MWTGLSVVAGAGIGLITGGLFFAVGPIATAVAAGTGFVGGTVGVASQTIDDD